MIVYLGLGTNKGCLVENIEKALGYILENNSIDLIKSSNYYLTEPVGMDTLDWFINSVIKIETRLTVFELLKLLNRIEENMGRTDKGENKSRVIDLDILFYEKEVINTKDLIVPHKELHKRFFVIDPMLEIDPEFIHPVLHKSIRELKEELETKEQVFKLIKQ